MSDVEVNPRTSQGSNRAQDPRGYGQRDIVLIPFPYSDLTGSKQRPALIISNEKLNKTKDRLCCLVTTKPSKGCLLIEKNSFEKGTLPFKSWVKPYRLFTIHEKIVKRRLCTVSLSFFNKVLRVLGGYLG